MIQKNGKSVHDRGGGKVGSKRKYAWDQRSSRNFYFKVKNRGGETMKIRGGVGGALGAFGVRKG